MPKMDGYEFHHHVRGKAELSHVPFVFLTALDSEEDLHRGMSSGADEYVTKPFDPRSLLAVVRGKVVRAHGLKHSTEQKYELFRKKVIHTLSHEFRTPLVAINTGTEMLLEQIVKEDGNLEAEKVQGLIEAIQRGGHRLERLVTDFMLLQQIEAGVAQRLYNDRKTIIDAGKLLRSWSESAIEMLEKEGFQTSFECLCDDVQIEVFEPQILDILRRFVSNSIKFKGTRKEVRIFGYMQSERVIFEVRDRGVGFDPSKIQQAIETFGQIDRDRMEQQGGGLGLAISSKYAAINKAKLEFSTRPGGGACVSLVIPMHS